jgi:hypothetical protein
MSRLTVSVSSRWRDWLQAFKSLPWHPQWSVDVRLLVLTILNALLYWPWRLLRQAFDAGNHHPNLVLGLLLVTLWMWIELCKAVTARFKG